MTTTDLKLNRPFCRPRVLFRFSFFLFVFYFIYFALDKDGQTALDHFAHGADGERFGGLLPPRECRRGSCMCVYTIRSVCGGGGTNDQIIRNKKRKDEKEKKRVGGNHLQDTPRFQGGRRRDGRRDNRL